MAEHTSTSSTNESAQDGADRVPYAKAIPEPTSGPFVTAAGVTLLAAALVTNGCWLAVQSFLWSDSSCGFAVCSRRSVSKRFPRARMRRLKRTFEFPCAKFASVPPIPQRCTR